MLPDISFMNILFKLLNFIIFLGVCWYLYYRYGKKYIEEKITEEQSLIHGLDELQYTLEGQYLEYEERLDQQEKYIDHLKQKIEIWQEAIKKQKVRREKENIALADQLNKRMREKSVYYTQKKSYALLLPEIEKEARAALQAQFQDPREQKEFLHHIIERMSHL